jgi:hypothetical protein
MCVTDQLSGLWVPPPPPSDLDPVAPKLLLSLSHDEVVRLVHRPGSIFPAVCPCDPSNGSDTKTHWTLGDNTNKEYDGVDDDVIPLCKGEVEEPRLLVPLKASREAVASVLWCSTRQRAWSLSSS